MPDILQKIKIEAEIDTKRTKAIFLCSSSKLWQLIQITANCYLFKKGSTNLKIVRSSMQSLMYYAIYAITENPKSESSKLVPGLAIKRSPTSL